MNIRRMGQMLAIVLAWCLWPAAAQAQQYPCNGPGPGERLVAMVPNGPNAPPTPLCERIDSGSTSAPSSGGNNSYAALAWHRDAADVWVDGNYANGENIAERGALDACNRVMGGGCTTAGEWGNSSVSIIRDRNGNFYYGWNGEGGADRAKAMAECSDKQLLPCEVFTTIRSSTNKRFPGAGARKFFAAAAWIVGTDGYDNKIYIASGHRTGEASNAAALNACKAATSRPCELATLATSGFIQAYRLNKEDGVTPETSAKRAQEAARANCKKQAKVCELQAVFDSRKSGLFVHDFAAGKAR